jgi:hypothetical protein
MYLAQVSPGQKCNHIERVTFTLKALRYLCTRAMKISKFPHLIYPPYRGIFFQRHLLHLFFNLNGKYGKYLKGGDDRVVSILLLARAKTVQGDGACRLELRLGHKGDAHGESEGADGQDNGDLR